MISIARTTTTDDLIVASSDVEESFREKPAADAGTTRERSHPTLVEYADLGSAAPR
jgi:hypothetical protein